MLSNYHPKISSVTLVPSSGGIFEVSLDGKLIFSKKQQGRFPEDEEILSQVEQL
ncbi:MAG: Rdx family protein [Chloroflexota bacterium]|nr:Rdx family protein [Chloroflexota bacterium]